MKNRRVGTLTLGVALVLVGVLVTLALINKDSALKILQFSPLILIMLGGEVLFYTFRYKEEKLIYDGLSIFMVIMITVVTIAASTIIPAIDHVIKTRAVVVKAQRNTKVELEDIVAKQNLDASVAIYDSYGFHNDFWFDSDNDQFRFNCNIDVSLHGKMEKEQVIQNAQTFFNAVKAKDFKINDIRITYSGEIQQYSILLTNSQLKNLSTTLLENKLEIRHDDADDSVSSQITEESQPET